MEEMLRYFITRTTDDFKALNTKVDHVSTRVDELWGFRMRTMGVVVGISGVLSVLVTLLTIYLQAH